MGIFRLLLILFLPASWAADHCDFQKLSQYLADNRFRSLEEGINGIPQHEILKFYVGRLEKNAKEMGMPTYEYFQKWGLRKTEISPELTGQKIYKLAVPDIQTLFLNMERSIDELVEKGIVKAEDAIYPALVYRSPKGEVKAFRVNEAVPEGFVLADTQIIKSYKTFKAMVAEGKFPIGSPTFGVDQGSPMMFHDMGHIVSFAKNPQYMKAFKGLASLSKDKSVANSWFSFFSESFVAFRSGARKDFLGTLASYGIGKRKNSDKVLDVVEYYKKIKNLSDADALKLGRSLSALAKNEVVPLGGSSMDPLNAIHAYVDPKAMRVVELTGRLRKVNDEIERISELHYFSHQYKPDDVLPEQIRNAMNEYLTYVAVHMDIGTRLEPEQWIQRLSQGTKLKKGEPLYEIICRSKFFSEDRMKAVCAKGLFGF